MLGRWEKEGVAEEEGRAGGGGIKKEKRIRIDDWRGFGSREERAGL
jgi:hypothetical protein